MKKEYRGRALLAGTVALSFGMPLALSAAGNPEEIIKYRQNVMGAVGGHSGAAEAILEKKVDFRNDLVEHARGIEASTRNIPAMFPQGTDKGADTRAREEIWTNRERFEQRSKETHEKAVAFVKAAAANNDAQAQAAFKELDKSCTACHRDFRKRRQQ